MRTFSISMGFLPTVALGAAIRATEACGAHFTIYNFTASCIPHSLFCAIDFNVKTAPGAPNVECSYWGIGPDLLPKVELSGCQDSDVSFSFGSHGHHDLTIVSALALGQNVTGTYDIPDSDIVVEDHGSVQTENYEGPSTFNISGLTTILP
ncbi:hypothetical protein F5Y05DRAFT_403122 [Hypoxylon sp. FL0543]|nr:hypothetical protein F5Y05DRAFT_403122 [Hypoxylon sp. FL0543]